MSLTIYGSSDDLIEVEGDISEEYTDYNNPEGSVLAFSNGAALRIAYSDSGVWRIVPLTGDMQIAQALEDDDDNYSDVATVTGDVRWIVRGTDWKARPKAGE